MGTMKEDYTEKADTLSVHLKMKSLAANGDAVAQFRLAQSYPINSTNYLKWMEAAAQQGLTNALLALSQAFAEKGSLKQAAQCLLRILSTDDSYMKAEAKNFLIQNRSLKAVLSQQMATKFAKMPCRFFTHDAAAEKPKELQQAPAAAEKPTEIQPAPELR